MNLHRPMALALVFTAVFCVGAFAASPPQHPQEKLPTKPGCKVVHVKRGSEQDVRAIGDRKVGRGLDFYSLQRAVTLGKGLAQEVERSAQLVHDPVILNYINKVGEKLARSSDARVPFTFKVIDSEAVNAFSLPGGFVFIDSGLILRASNEAELVGVMAHEIAHVAARHGTKQATKKDIAKAAMVPISILLPYGWAGYGISQGTNFGVPLAFLHFSRKDEEQADYLGIEYMWKAGYDPNAYVDFFEKIRAANRSRPGTVPRIFETHPPTRARIVAAEKEISSILPCRSKYIVDTSEFEKIKSRLASEVSSQQLEQEKYTLRMREKAAEKRKKEEKAPVLEHRFPDKPH